jgi:hypothetical protein
VKTWLFAEDDGYVCEHHRADVEHLFPRREDPVVALFSGAIHLCGVVALGLLLYWHVPAVKTWTDHHLRGKKATAAARAQVSDHPVDSNEEDRTGPPSFPKDAPSPAPLVSSLPVTKATPLVAVTSGKRVALYQADGRKLWSRISQRALFSPAGNVVLLDRGSAGWAAVDARTAQELPWSANLGWVRPSAQVQWSPSGELLSFEWPVSDGGMNAVGVYSASQRRWLVQAVFEDGIGCAENAAWSPDEHRLAMRCDGGAVVLDLIRGQVTRQPFPSGEGNIIWDPHGEQLVTSGSLGDDDEGAASLVQYSPKNGSFRYTLLDGDGSYAQPLGWMGGGKVIVYRTPSEDTWDGAPVYLARWPSGEMVARLGAFGHPRINVEGSLAALYSIRRAAGGTGELTVATITGKGFTVEPASIVGIPLKWIEKRKLDLDTMDDHEVSDWVLDYGWKPGTSELYFVARRGLRSWCLWRWDASSRTARPVGREVQCFESPDEVDDKGFELVFSPPRR